ncbi:MAG: hypothetical protein EP329_11945 [Deltaproteobacteria bacterium]|nr:MAG: hypothetical protein EP329_11945 [Deltaproteobacteria bacterium]
MSRSAIAALAAALALTACTAPPDIGAHVFACTTLADCGEGAYCGLDGVCHPLGEELPDVTSSDDVAPPDVVASSCQSTLKAATPSDEARFVLETDLDTGSKTLHVYYDGLHASYPVSDDIVDLVPHGCCEDPCCAALADSP